MKRTWSLAAESKLRKLYATTPLARLAFLLKRTEKAVRSRAKLLGVTRGKAKRWTADEVNILRARYRDEFTATIARDLGRQPLAVCQKAIALGLSKSRELLQAMGHIYSQHPKAIAARIKPGTVPPNKGLRRPGWAPGRMASTQFKKGCMSGAAQHNYVPIGSERLCKDGYLERKVTDDHPVPARRWVAVHRIVWEAAHGPVPKGHAVVFRNDDKTDIRIANLECIPRSELMLRNSYHKLPAPLPQLIQLRGALNRKINRRTVRAEQDGRPA